MTIESGGFMNKFLLTIAMAATFLPNVIIGGMDVGGMTNDAALSALEAEISVTMLLTLLN